jgi:pectate lyase
MHSNTRLLSLIAILTILAACESGGGDGAGEPAVLFEVNASHDTLLGRATGYFAAAGGTGGQGGDIYYVTNLNDDGPGSLREALTREEPLIILFEDGLSGTLNVTSDDIDVRSNKTLLGVYADGSGADVFIHGGFGHTPFKIADGHGNVIIANIKGDAPGPNDDAPDFIRVQGEGGLVWIHHVTVVGDGSSDMDGFVDIHSENVTISWCRIENWDNVHLVYPYPDAGGNVSVTLTHNLYRNSAGRQPKLQSDNVRVHAYNNWLDGWGYDGMRVEGGELVAENNVFTPAGDTRAIQGVWGGSGNAFLNGAYADDKSPVFMPPYDYVLKPVTTPEEQQALRDRLEAETGWQAEFFYTPATTLPAPQPAPQGALHVVDITLDLVGRGRSGNYQSYAAITVADEAGMPVSGASVRGDWTWNETDVSDSEGLTDGMGVTVVRSRKVNPSSGDVLRFTVTDVALDGYSYASESNGESSDSIDVPSD